MTLNDLIARLQQLQGEHGHKTVMVQDINSENIGELTGSINVEDDHIVICCEGGVDDED